MHPHPGLVNDPFDRLPYVEVYKDAVGEDSSHHQISTGSVQAG